MSWGRFDDGVSINRKLAQLNDRERRILGDGLWAYCARERNGGYFTDRELHHCFYHRLTQTYRLTPGQLARFVETGLVDNLGNGQYKVHNWERYVPRDPTATERKRRQRAKQHRDSHERDDSDSHDVTTRDHARAVPVPSLRTTPPNPPTGGNRRTSEERRADRFADSLNEHDRMLFDAIVPGDQRGIVSEYQQATGLRYVRGSHGSSWKLDPLGSDQKPGGFEAGLVPPGFAGKPSPGEFLNAWLRQFTSEPSRSGTEVLLQLVEPVVSVARAGGVQPEGVPDGV